MGVALAVAAAGGAGDVALRPMVEVLSLIHI